MISTRIPMNDPKSDNYARLAKYIADTKNKGEKCLMTWTAGCWAGQDYDLAIEEVVATQDLNTRSQKEKTYHLVVAFPEKDHDKLTPEVFKNIEETLAKALGFEEHQRHCGVHMDTNNMHMHIAYNMIDKEKKTRKSPYYDYFKRDRACRELEKKYGLEVTPGHEKQTQSFEEYAKERKGEVLDVLDNAQNWQDLHQGLAKYGLSLYMRGNGCSLGAISYKAKEGKRIKASDLDRGLSKAELEKRFGWFEKSKGDYEIKEYYGRQPKRENSKAKDFEVRTGLKSFNTYVKERKDILHEVLENAGTWQDLHQGLAKHGLEVRLSGNGCAIQALESDVKGKPWVTASSAGRSFSKGSLEKKLGEFEKSQGDYEIEEVYAYEPIDPLKTAKEKEMWRIYLQEKKQAREASYRVQRSWLEFKYQMGKFFEEDRGMDM